MSEVARNIATRLRKFIGDRRRAPRCAARLPFVVSLPDSRPAVFAGQVQSLSGHTLDISATGLALLVPAIRIGDHYLAGEGRELQVVLELPQGPVVIQGSAVRYERVDEEGSEKGYLIGVNNTSMSVADRMSYEEYVAGLLN